MLGGIGGRRRSGRQRMRWLDGITDSMDVSLSELSHIDSKVWVFNPCVMLPPFLKLTQMEMPGAVFM